MIAALAGHTADPRLDQQEWADAKLIAAAPHLVNACRIALDFVRRLQVTDPQLVTRRLTAEGALTWALGMSGVDIPGFPHPEEPGEVGR